MKFEKGYEVPPFGPLTREDFTKICLLAFYDGGAQPEAQQLAESRGVKSHDYMKLQFKASEAGFIGPRVLNSGENPDGSSWTTYDDGETLLTDPSGVQFYNE